MPSGRSSSNRRGYIPGGAIYYNQSGVSLSTHIPGWRFVMSSNVVDACGLLRTQSPSSLLATNHAGLDVCFEITRAIRASTHEGAHESRLAAQSGPSKFLGDECAHPHCVRVMLARKPWCLWCLFRPEIGPKQLK
jgi:hypothetical protein